MIILFYVGIFASYLLVLKRENRRFPWLTFLAWFVPIVVLIAGIVWLCAHYFGYKLVTHSPFLVR